MKFATTQTSILIEGESGTGKELFAQSIHNSSKRKHNAFVAINCAALPETLLDSELFGYETGAFTGASKDGKKGLFELADKGTIFLDEISEMPIHLQSKLLRVLQEREVMRIGGNKIIPVDVRIIVATNKDLVESIAQKNFREDLYYRIGVLQLFIPPLRARKDDILDIAFQYTKKEKEDTKLLENPTVKELLKTYLFPGNVRELINVLQRYYVYCKDEELNEKTLALFMQKALTPGGSKQQSDSFHLKEPSLNLKNNEIILIQKSLVKQQGNKQAVSEELGISRSTLWRKIEEYGL